MSPASPMKHSRKFARWREQQMGREPKASTLNTHNSALNRVFDESVGARLYEQNTGANTDQQGQTQFGLKMSILNTLNSYIILRGIQLMRELIQTWPASLTRAQIDAKKCLPCCHQSVRQHSLLARQNGRNSRQHNSLVIGPVGLGPAMVICQKSQSNCSKPVCMRMMKCVSCLLLSVTPGCG